MVFNKAFCFFASQDWHRVLGHASPDRINKTMRCIDGNVKMDMDIDKCGNCEICMQAKSRRRNFNHKLLTDTLPGNTLHSDICNLPSQSTVGSMYAILFADECSRYTRIYFLKSLHAKEILRAISNCLSDQNKDLRRLPTRLHTDRGTGYLSQLVKDYLQIDNKIQMTNSCSHSHEQNGLSEKTIQDVMMVARSMLFDAKLPAILWAEAMNNAVYVMNRLYKQSINVTSFEKYHGFKPSINHIKRFGREVMVHIPKINRNGKLDVRAEKMILAGHTESTVNYRICNKRYSNVHVETNLHFLPDEKNIDDDRVVLNDPIQLFNASVFPDSTDADEVKSQPEKNEESVEEEDEREEDVTNDVDLTIIPYSEFIERANQNSKTSEVSTLSDEPNSNTQTAMREQYYDFLIRDEDLIVPKSIKQIEENKYSYLWYDACDKEVLSIYAAGTITLV